MTDPLKKAVAAVARSADNSANATESHANELWEDIKDCENLSGEIRAETRWRIGNDLEPHLTLYRIAHYSICGLFFAIDERSKRGERLLWPVQEVNANTRLPEESVVVSSIAANLVNYSLAIGELLFTGLNLQARALMRSYVELTDCFVAIAADKSTYENYISEPDDPSKFKSHWQQHFSHKRLKELLSHVAYSDRTMAPLADWLLSFKEHTYSFLSNAAHVSYGNQTVLAHSSQGCLKVRRVPLALFGAADTATRGSLNHYIVNTWCFLAIIRKLVTTTHGWHMNGPSSARLDWAVRVFGASVALNQSLIFSEPSTTGKSSETNHTKPS